MMLRIGINLNSDPPPAGSSHVMMASRHRQSLPFALQKLLNLMQNVASSKDRTTKRSSNRRFRFESFILVQARQDLDGLLTRQVIPSPTQSSQSVEERQVFGEINVTNNRIHWMRRLWNLLSQFRGNSCRWYSRRKS